MFIRHGFDSEDGLWGQGASAPMAPTYDEAKAAKALALAAKVAAAGDDDRLTWDEMDAVAVAVAGTSYATAIEYGLVNPCTMPTGLKKWVAVANGLI